MKTIKTSNEAAEGLDILTTIDYITNMEVAKMTDTQIDSIVEEALSTLFTQTNGSDFCEIKLNDALISTGIVGQSLQASLRRLGRKGLISIRGSRIYAKTITFTAMNWEEYDNV